MKNIKMAVVCSLLAAVFECSMVHAESPDSLVPEVDTSMNVLPGAWIAVESKSKTGEYWNTVQKGMEDAIDAVNEAYQFSKNDKITMTFEGPSEETDVSSQINVLDAIIAENPNVLCLSAADISSCQAQLEAARENGIPVVIFDSTVEDENLIQAYRSSNNHQIGLIAGEKLAEALGGSGKIAVFSAQEKTSSVIERMNGFQEVIGENADLEIVSVVYQDQVEDMSAAVRDVLEQNPDLSGVYCTNADSTDIYLSFDKELREGIILVGTDGTTNQQNAIRSGEELGTVSQDPYAIGYQTILAAVAMTAPTGSENLMQKTILLSPRWIDLDNIDLPENAEYLYGK